jgi:hypothetical protein
MNRVYFFVQLFVFNAVISMNIIVAQECTNSKTEQQDSDGHTVTPLSLQQDSSGNTRHMVTPVSPKKKKAGAEECVVITLMNHTNKTNQTYGESLKRQSSAAFLASVPSHLDMNSQESFTDLDGSLNGGRTLSAPNNNNLHGVTPIKVVHGVTPVDRKHEVTPVGR